MLRRRRLQRRTTVDMVPMIDVVFQLVIFFMVSSTFKITPAIGLTLPDSATATPTEMSQLVVAVHSEELIYLNDRELDLRGLADAFAGGGIVPDAVGSVIVEGERTVSYQLLVDVLDIVRLNGFKDVALRTRPIPREEAR